MMQAFINQGDNSARRYSLRTHGAGRRLAPNFVLGEFRSKDGADIVLVHDNLIALLQMIRYKFDKPIDITSGYRTRAHNATVSQATHSPHIFGLAADIKVRDISPREVQSFVRELGIGGIGSYGTFTHVDVRGVNRRF
jgi:uncharacterized protein YcbK (DUF882 family)